MAKTLKLGRKGYKVYRQNQLATIQKVKKLKKKKKLYQYIVKELYTLFSKYLRTKESM